ncbi:MAG TPA: transglutaminase-like domain-containing protein [Pirellulales bacterium]|nr:transglutaminase-like domain-containing protein [Pirellulales bacterium]
MNSRLALTAAIAAVLLASRPAAAQFKDPAPEKGAKLGTPVTQKYQVGLIIKPQSMQMQNLLATVPVPVDWPEQSVKVVNEELSPNIPELHYRTSSITLRQMLIEVPHVPAGQPVKALVTLEVSHAPQIAPADTSIYKVPKKLDRKMLTYLGPSPGIEVRHPKITSLAKELVAGKETAWQQVEAIYDWVMTNIKPSKGELKGATRTLLDKSGDPEDMASLFIALCRASKIPARTVFVPQHVYPEFYLWDDDDHGHWFPCQTDGMRQFGGISETGPIVQKGENLHDAERPKEKMRLVPENLKVSAAKPPSEPAWIREVLPQ